jgi:hypothetical protein
MPDGKICYMEIPAADVDAAAGFYSAVFGWKVRARGDGAKAFDDTTGAVSGSFVAGRPPAREPGILTYVMVDSIESTSKKIVAAGGRMQTPFTSIGAGGEAFATFRDPAGNVLGLYQGRRT